MRNKVPVVVGIGELLWDVFPQRKTLGGAPANVIFNCNQLGTECCLVSELGDDDLGTEMKGMLAELRFRPDFLNICEGHPTGTVSVRLDAGGNPRYKIRENVAWDYIRWSPRLKDLATIADAVCFGSLAQRSPVSRATIGRFLECTRPDCLRVFDINLREPYPDSAVVLASLKRANVVKVNIDELDYLSSLLQLTGDVRNRLTDMLCRFHLSCVALTRGAQGSTLVTNAEAVDCPGLEVDVEDTVGAGDAFTGAMIVGMLRRRPLREINATAGRIAACVCAQTGAMVELPGDVVRGLRGTVLPIREHRSREAVERDAFSVRDVRDAPEEGE
ncbi:MAG: carbohydrate kinase [Sedimentisphaerales bacterium]|nr:carbohydrate kinase [Sedimentisphaerales bacterium]HOI35862.1 carbohydrate kinase [Bacillota bacterium]